jgi:N-methylhydantoinase B
MNLVLSGSGKAVSMNVGVNGGYPGNTQSDITVRDSNVHQILARGEIPSDLKEIAGRLQYEPSEIETFLEVNDTYFLFWQAGGGYGDPILREPERVRRDVIEFKVSPEVARDIYGVELTGADYEIGVAQTARLREAIRNRRKERAHIPDPNGGAATADGKPSGIPLNENIAEVALNGRQVLACRYCGRELCATNADILSSLALVEGDPGEAGPQVFNEGWRFIDTKVVFRQYCCPGCMTAFSTQVVPVDHPVVSDHAEVG